MPSHCTVPPRRCHGISSVGVTPIDAPTPERREAIPTMRPRHNATLVANIWKDLDPTAAPAHVSIILRLRVLSPLSLRMLSPLYYAFVSFLLFHCVRISGSVL